MHVCLITDIIYLNEPYLWGVVSLREAYNYLCDCISMEIRLICLYSKGKYYFLMATVRSLRLKATA